MQKAEYHLLLGEGYKLEKESWKHRSIEKKNYLKKALKKYEEATKINPDKTISFVWNGDTLRKLAQLSKGKEKRKYLEKALKVYEKIPSTSTYYYYRGYKLVEIFCGLSIMTTRVKRDECLDKAVDTCKEGMRRTSMGCNEILDLWYYTNGEING